MRKAVSYALLALVLGSNLGGHAAAQSVPPEEFGETVSEAIGGGNEYFVPEPEPAQPRAAPPVARPVARPAPPPRTAPPASGGSPPPKGGAFYSDCPNAWAMGQGPLRRGQPGYRPELAPDGDGVACEPIG